jgi:5-carboxymethyl-2-hydroxymuconate isomerase
MAHATIEWTDNLADDLDIGALMHLVAGEMQASSHIFPVGGIRVRAIRLTDYVIADGSCAEDSFVNVDFKIGAGREGDTIRQFFDGMFESISDHLALLFDKRPFALSQYVEEAHGWKQNSIHRRLKKDA